MVKKLKISTLDGAETNSKTHTTLLIPDNQSIGCINFNSINYRNLTRARMKTTVLLIKMKKNWKGLIFLEGPKSHLGSILSCFRPIFFGKIKNPHFRKNLLLCTDFHTQKLFKIWCRLVTNYRPSNLNNHYGEILFVINLFRVNVTF